MAALAGLTLVRVGRQNVPPAIGVACLSKRNSSDISVVKGQTANPGAYKRGTGGRSSFSGIVATVLGSSGFVGRYVVNRLGKIGSQVICPYRGEPYFMKDLRLAGDLGQILFLPYDLRDEDSLRKCMKYSNVVINLVGREWETKNFNYNDVNVHGAARIARIAREMGVEKLIHFSHLNASPTLKSIYVPRGSKYLRSKYYGEEAVRNEFPDATIFRPSDIYGPEDRFLRYYANAWRRARGHVPLWKKGAETVKMPVFVSDVARGVIEAIHNPDAAGQTYECVGPNSYYLSDLVDYIYRCMRWPNFKRTWVTPGYLGKVTFMSMAPAYPILSLDKLDMEHQSDVLNGLATLEDLGVKLTKLESRANYELKPFRTNRYYEEKVGEFADPDPPPVIA